MKSPNATETAVDAVAVFRLVRLLQVDELPPLPRWRQAILRRWGQHEAAELVVCPWCLGVHVAALVALARWRFPTAWTWVARILVGSAAAGAITTAVDS